MGGEWCLDLYFFFSVATSVDLSTDQGTIIMESFFLFVLGSAYFRELQVPREAMYVPE